MAFSSTGTQQIFLKRITQQGIEKKELLWSEVGLSHLQENLNYNFSVVNKKQQNMWRC